MGISKITYSEISKAKVSPNRNVIISDCSRGGFTIAQQMEMEEEGKIMNVFLKGAIHINNIDGLYELREAVNLAISHANKIADEEQEQWDE